jgi:hypothetical protein
MENLIGLTCNAYGVLPNDLSKAINQAMTITKDEIIEKEQYLTAVC